MKTTCMVHLVLASCALGMTAPAFSMDFKPGRIALYTKGELLGIQEFVAANEGVVDYLATLKRPTPQTEPFRYDCMVKSRVSNAFLQTIPNSDPYGAWVDILTVYAVQDCKPRQ